jgi:hypothetical protein
VAAAPCSLDETAYGDRIAEWERLLDGAGTRTLPDGGRAARLPADRSAEAARPAVAEQRCCPLFSFRLDFAGDHVELVANVPDEAESLIAALFDRNVDSAEGCR